ncbi:hypothetical protein DPMN_180019 [Dreissena polymorpha]|uniref:Uncharacterized protein n=1 Tax=Dreissena polymorpha TaxID=45954 RepID=A0A9D4IMU9_DREPO|nr:hypothetical protein DPMN_180019 [Dreissena polymorpha]
MLMLILLLDTDAQTGYRIPMLILATGYICSNLLQDTDAQTGYKILMLILATGY